ncbi:MAG: NAD-dependent epimerase/dehydratase family protein [Saprospiraceae bacterium]|nr:NAD-dependent epimerase/dehydratase family protein [Saprospiraceae bacterium]
MDHILITGGAGFVGANLAIYLKQRFPRVKISVLDNLIRRGSELNIPRLQDATIDFIRGDVRNREELLQLPAMDVIIDAAAEPSVLSGIKDGPQMLVDINFQGTLNCLELARKYKSDFIYLSTNRVYSYPLLNSLSFTENTTRFEYASGTPYFQKGIDENFDTSGLKSFYGASKLASESFIREYAHHYDFNAIINRCGVIAGPWQMGKVDQGFVALWVIAHYFGKSLQYLGYGGQGKQVRDVLHVDDLCKLISSQLSNDFPGECKTYNVGGTWTNSISLLELTGITENITGRKLDIGADEETRVVDMRIYYTDASKVQNDYQWQAEKTVEECVADTFNWINKNEKSLVKIFKH